MLGGPLCGACTQQRSHRSIRSNRPDCCHWRRACGHSHGESIGAAALFEISSSISCTTLFASTTCNNQRRLGYNKVTVLERTDRVGGKSLTLYRNFTGECVQQKDPEALLRKWITPLLVFSLNGGRKTA